MNQVQYQLIKTYPGSAPINSIFEFMNGMFRATFIGQVFTTSDNDVKMPEFFKKITFCEMKGKLIRKKESKPSRGTKSDKTVYKVTGFANVSETSFSIVSIFGDSKEVSIPKNFNYWIEVFRYWFIDSKGKIQTGFYTSDELMNRNEHSYRKSIGNFFETKNHASLATIKVISGN